MQGLYPTLHVNVQALLTHLGCALATLVEQALPQMLQLLGSLVVSTQLRPHSVGEPDGQLDEQAYVPLAAAQTGVLPLHMLLQVPQLDALAGSTQPPSHAIRPLPQVPGPPSAASPSSAPAAASFSGGTRVSTFASAGPRLSASAGPSMPPSHAPAQSFAE